MRYPALKDLKAQRQTVDVFKGYNHNLRIGEGEFFDMENMTSDDYPVLSPRKKRGVYAASGIPGGMICKDSLCYVDGKDFIINGYRVEMELSLEEGSWPKTLTSMGAYVIIMPDKKWINTMDLSEYGDIEASFRSQGTVTFSLCAATGEAYEGATACPEAPENPQNMALWIDTSATPHTLKQYSTVNAVWVQIATTYVKIAAAGIGKNFGQYDGVRITGIADGALQELCASAVIMARDTDYITVTGIIDTVVTQTAAQGAVTVERRMPAMDFVIESGNRLWGCRYGSGNDGTVVNEIYASKLGDFKNWSCYMGLSTDSYAASCGTDGQFTGAIAHLGYPLFFKENCLHKVYGNYPSNFQIQTTACRGVQKGCHESLATVNEVLYYKARSGICSYDGSLPVEISADLGQLQYSDASAGGHGNKYYISMKEERSGQYSLFVYDTAKGMWHREDSFRAQSFCSCRGELYAISGGKIIAMLGSGTQDTEPVEWMAQTGDIGLSSPDTKYISRITVRVAMEAGATLEILGQYDFSDRWESLCRLQSDRLQSFSVPVRPKRCDHMRLRFEGSGNVRIYAVTKTVVQGSELA